MRLAPSDDIGDPEDATHFARTDADGLVTVRLQPRRWRASVRPVGAPIVSADVVVAETDTPSVELRLP